MRDSSHHRSVERSPCLQPLGSHAMVSSDDQYAHAEQQLQHQHQQQLSEPCDQSQHQAMSVQPHSGHQHASTTTDNHAEHNLLSNITQAQGEHVGKSQAEERDRQETDLRLQQVHTCILQQQLHLDQNCTVCEIHAACGIPQLVQLVADSKYIAPNLHAVFTAATRFCPCMS